MPDSVTDLFTRQVRLNRDVNETLWSETETRPRLLILSPRRDRNRDLPKFSWDRDLWFRVRDRYRDRDVQDRDRDVFRDLNIQVCL